VTGEIRELIRRMKTRIRLGGAPRIHGELLQLGFNVSEPTVSRYLQRIRRRYDEGKAKRWLAFLNNHREVIAAFDFFTVPNVELSNALLLLIVEHGRRRILHFNCTEHPTANWIVQQLREGSAAALPLSLRPVWSLWLSEGELHWTDTDVFAEPVQNRIAERCVGSARRELMDNIIPPHEQHLRWLGREYLAYYHQDQTHITQSSLNLESVVFTIAIAGQK